MDIRTSIGKPSSPDQWEQLCRSNGNLQQSLFYDAVQAYFRQYPVYIEIWRDNMLIGGSKIYVYVPGRLRPLLSPLSKYFLQAGESILLPGEEAESIIPYLKAGFMELLGKESPVWFNSYGYYDHPEWLLQPDKVRPRQEVAFANAWVPLNPSPDQIWKGIHPHHQNKILKAERKGYSVIESEDIDLFLKLLSNTYEVQGRHGPNPGFVKAFYTIMRPPGFSKIYLAVHDQKPVSGVLLTLYGKISCYSFGGSLRNNDGASQLLHWKIIQYLAEQNCSKYFLGQVAIDERTGDEKFREGISPFKRRFGTNEVNSSRKTFIFKPYSYSLWKMITILTGKK